jgi:hypothetical protein
LPGPSAIRIWCKSWVSTHGERAASYRDDPYFIQVGAFIRSCRYTIDELFTTRLSHV